VERFDGIKIKPTRMKELNLQLEKELIADTAMPGGIWFDGRSSPDGGHGKGGAHGSEKLEAMVTSYTKFKLMQE
jgi:hypothetical protein